MAGESHTTTDHGEIRRWVEERCDDESLEEISCDEWLEKLDENGLAFVYQDETKEGEESRLSKLVSREAA
jgi:hypothetical protein